MDKLLMLVSRLVELEEAKLARKKKSNHVTSIKDPIDGLQIQELLNMSRTSVYRRTKDKTFKAKKVGGRNVYSRSQILEYKDQYLK